MRWLRGAGRRSRLAGNRTSGRPPSANGASSLQLEWAWDGSEPALVEVAATLTVLRRPTVDRLVFWALQASFLEGPGAGRRHGGGHLGLQHHPRHPGAGAVNWGGYDAAGSVLRGTESRLPSALDNANTRDLAWEAGVAHRLSISRGHDGWTGRVDGVEIRRLLTGGDRLASILVWTESFADCDHPGVVVRWSDLVGRTVDGEEVHPVAVITRYQDVAAGGCSNTSSDPDPTAIGAVRQATAVPRRTGPGQRIDLV